MNIKKQPVNVVSIEYNQTGNSVCTNSMGMREMQQRVYKQRHSKYLLIKAPPASGKSRALMFVGLDKLFNQNRRKIIVSVPERSIGASFETTALKSHGFFANWEVDDKNNLCTPGAEKSKVEAFVAFMNSNDPILICTHATLRLAFEALSPDAFNGCVLAIDEFHHVSSDVGSSRLGSLLRDVMSGSDIHIIAMTGSYFRGDAVPILLPEDEAKFSPVTFNYYDQLNGYEHLKSLGIGYHFYQGQYTSAIHEVLNTDKKTIIHIPNVNSGESTKDKIEEVGQILSVIGEVVYQDDDTGIIHVKRHEDGKIIKAADLVDDTDQIKRAKTLTYLSQVAKKDIGAVDIIIALGMAKEGFDWPFCEHALTVGYRASLTEIIQIIGRCTRDSSNKTQAQFTNLIAEPEATTDEVLAPNFKFKTKTTGDDASTRSKGIISIRGFKEPSSDRVKQIIETDLNDLKANILQDEIIIKASATNLDPQVTNKVLIPKIIRERYPDLSETQIEELRQQVVVDSVIKNGETKAVGDRRFIKMADKFVNIDEINIDLIDSVNPFQKAFEILSKSVTAQVLRVIQEAIAATRIDVTEEEAELLWPKINLFYELHGRKPDINSRNEQEKRMAEVLSYLQRKKREDIASGDSNV